MTATLNRADVVKRYELMSIEEGFTKVVPTEKLSTEFMMARLNFAAWYDAKPESIQELIDEIAEATSFIIDEDEYDEFIDLLSDYGIETAQQFADAFTMEYEGYGEHIYAQFAEEMCDYIDMTSLPEFIQSNIDWLGVYHYALQYDFNDFDFKGNRYFFRNSY